MDTATKELKEAAELVRTAQYFDALQKFDAALTALAGLSTNKRPIQAPLSKSGAKTDSKQPNWAERANLGYLFDPQGSGVSSTFVSLFTTGLINRTTCFSYIVSASGTEQLLALIDACVVWIDYRSTLSAQAAEPYKSLILALQIGVRSLEKDEKGGEVALRSSIQLTIRAVKLMDPATQLEAIFEQCYRMAYYTANGKLKDFSLVFSCLQEAGLPRNSEQARQRSPMVLSQYHISCLVLLAKSCSKTKDLRAFEEVSKELQLCGVALQQQDSPAAVCLAGLAVVSYASQQLSSTVESRASGAQDAQRWDDAMQAASRLLKSREFEGILSASHDKAIFKQIYDTFWQIHLVLHELRWLFIHNVSGVLSRPDAFRLTLPIKALVSLEELMLAHSKLVIRGLFMDGKLTEKERKFSSVTACSWEAICYAGMVSMDRDFMNCVDAVLKYAQMALEVVQQGDFDAAVKIQGIQFISTSLLHNAAVAMYQRAEKTKAPDAYWRAAKLLQRSCELLEQASNEASQNNITAQDQKLADRLKLLARCKALSNDSSGAVNDAEAAIRKSTSLALSSLESYITRFVHIKLKSESTKDSLCDKTLLETLLSRSPKPSAEQIAEILAEEASCYYRARRYRHQLTVLNQLLDKVLVGSEFEIARSRALLDKAYALKQLDTSFGPDSATKCVSDALERLKNVAASQSEKFTEVLDDLASAAALCGLLQKETEDSETNRVDMMSQTTVELQAADGDPNTVPPSQPAKQGSVPASSQSTSASYKNLIFAVEQWTNLLQQIRRAPVDKATSAEALIKANRKNFRAADRTLRLMQSVMDFFVLLGVPEIRIKLCKLQLRLHRAVLGSSDADAEVIALYTDIAEIYASIGATSLSVTYFEKAKTHFKAAFQALKPQQKLSWLLSFARYSSDTGISDRLQTVAVAEQEIQKLFTEQRTSSSFSLLAKANSFRAHLVAAKGNIDEAIVLALEARKLRLSVLPRDSSSQTSAQTTRYRALAAYFDSVEQVGQLHELQGSAREAHYYYSRGLELASAVGAQRYQRRLSRRLAQLEVKRRRWNELNLVSPVAEHAISSVEDRVEAAELHDHWGDVRREQDQSLLEAAELYKQAEDAILALTDDSSVLDKLELITSSAGGADLLAGAPAKKNSAKSKGLSVPTTNNSSGMDSTPRTLKIMSRVGGSSSRLSIEPTRRTIQPQLIPIRQLKIRSRSKIGVVEFMAAVREGAPARLDAAARIFDGCISDVNAIIGERSDMESTASDNTLYFDMAFLLYYKARVALTQFNWSETPFSSSSRTIDEIWSAPAGHTASSKRLAEIRKTLDQAIDYTIRAGSHPNLTAEICLLRALVTGSSDAARTSALIHYSLGLTLRHQTLTTVIDRMTKHNKKAQAETRARLDSSSDSIEESSSDRVDTLAAVFARLTIIDDDEESEDSATQLSSSSDAASTSLRDDEIEIEEDPSDSNSTSASTLSVLRHLEAQKEILSFDGSPLELDPIKFKELYVDGLSASDSSPSSMVTKDIQNWTICSLSVLLDDLRHAIINRLEQGKCPMVVRAPLKAATPPATIAAQEAKPTSTKRTAKKAASKKSLAAKEDEALSSSSSPENLILKFRNELQEILQENTEMLKERSAAAAKTASKAKKPAEDSDELIPVSLDAAASNRAFWQKRTELDERMRKFISSIETDLLGWFKVFLLGKPVRSATKGDPILPSSLASRFSRKLDPYLIELVISGSEYLSDAELQLAVKWLTDDPQAEEDNADTDIDAIGTAIRSEFSRRCDAGVYEMCDCVELVLRGASLTEKVKSRPQRHPVVLVLDKQLHMFPWESMPCLSNFPVSRMPSLALLKTRLDQYLSTLSPANPLRDGIDAANAYYIMNPSGDIKSTETLLKPKVDQLKWDGIVGTKPSPATFLSSISTKDILLYAGHGGGHQYIDRRNISSSESSGLVLLMGCSSVASTDEVPEAQFDANGPAMAYLIAGCPSLVGNLWTVTTMDLDVETEVMLDWVASDEEPAKSALHAIPEARSRCQLKFINGAALVYYGIPIFKKRTVAPAKAAGRSKSSKATVSAVNDEELALPPKMKEAATSKRAGGSSSSSSSAAAKKAPAKRAGVR